MCTLVPIPLPVHRYWHGITSTGIGYWVTWVQLYRVSVPGTRVGILIGTNCTDKRIYICMHTGSPIYNCIECKLQFRNCTKLNAMRYYSSNRRFNQWHHGRARCRYLWQNSKTWREIFLAVQKNSNKTCLWFFFVHQRTCQATIQMKYCHMRTEKWPRKNVKGKLLHSTTCFLWTIGHLSAESGTGCRLVPSSWQLKRKQRAGEEN